MDAVLMEQLKNIDTKLTQVEADTGKLRSDTHDLKTDMAVVQTTLVEINKCIVKLESNVFGNGKEGYDTRLKELELIAKQNTDFRTDVKRLGWGLLALLAGDIILRAIGLI